MNTCEVPEPTKITQDEETGVITYEGRVRLFDVLEVGTNYAETLVLLVFADDVIITVIKPHIIRVQLGAKVKITTQVTVDVDLPEEEGQHIAEDLPLGLAYEVILEWEKLPHKETY